MTPAAPTTTHTFYVSPTGHDANAGTIDQPFRTLDKARLTVRALTSSMSGDITVHLRGGVHTLSDTVSFDQGDSGTGGHNVVYRNYPGETPILSGGEVITGWTAAGGGRYRANVGSLRFRQLYVNGARAVRARTPNAGSYNTIRSWNTSGQQISIDQGEIANWQMLNDVEMHVQVHWVSYILRVGSFTNAASVSLITPRTPERSRVFAASWNQGYVGAGYHFENAFELMDAPREWYLNPSTNELFYIPAPGEDMATAIVVAPRLEHLIRLTGTLASRIHNIHFYGLTFEHSNWTLPGSEGLVVHQGSAYDQSPNNPLGKIPPSVFVNRAERLRFERNTFRNLGGTGLAFWTGAQDNVVIGNVFKDSACSGVIIDLDNYHHTDITAAEVSRRNTISNNYVTKIGQDYPGCEAIQVLYTEASVIEHNEITDVPKIGISVGSGWTDLDTPLRDNLIRYNHIHRVMTLLDDGAGIYTLSKQPGTLIAENYIHDLVRSETAGRNAIAGVYLDNGSSLITVRDNVIQNVPTVIHQNVGGTVGQIPAPARNNTLLNNGGASPSTIDNAGLEPEYADIISLASVSAPPAVLMGSSEH